MKLEEITILKSLTPLTELDKPSKVTIEYLAKLIHEPEFNKILKTIRIVNNFSQENISIKEYLGKNFSEIPVIENEFISLSLQKVASDFCQTVGLSDDFKIQIILLFFFNAFIDIEYFEGFITTPIKFILGRKNIASTMFDYSHEVGAVIIPFNLSQRTFIKWIENKKNWEMIQRQMDDNLTIDPYVLRLHRNTELALEITEMHETDKLPFSEITTRLAKKYENDHRLTSEVTVKKIYYDYQGFWHSLPTQVKQK